MPSRKRSSQVDDAQQLPLREKRRKTDGKDEEKNATDQRTKSQGVEANRVSEGITKARVPTRQHSSESLEATEVLTKKSHVKFGSESPPPAANMAIEQLSVELEEEGEESDDEAPEEISHSHAVAESKATQAEEARLLKKRDDEAKDRRRKRDAQLKSQLEKSDKRRSQTDKGGPLADERDQVSIGNMSGKLSYDLDNLPTLLPDDLLAVEAPIRPPTPPLVDNKGRKIQNSDQVRVKRQERQPPTDVIYKGTKVRVLQTPNKLLPPKASGETRSIREAWLQGRAAFAKVDRKGSNISKFRRRAGPQAFI